MVGKQVSLQALLFRNMYIYISVFYWIGMFNDPWLFQPLKFLQPPYTTHQGQDLPLSISRIHIAHRMHILNNNIIHQEVTHLSNHQDLHPHTIIPKISQHMIRQMFMWYLIQRLWDLGNILFEPLVISVKNRYKTGVNKDYSDF